METLVEMTEHARDPQAILDRLASEIDKLAPIIAPDAPLDEIMGVLTALISDVRGHAAGHPLQ